MALHTIVEHDTTHIKPYIDNVKQALSDLTNYDANTGVKNLLNFRKEYKSYSSSGITFITNDDGTVTIKSGTSTSYAHYPQGLNAGEVYKDLKPNTKYIVDFGVTLSAAGALSVYYKETSSSDWAILTYATSGRELKFTTPNSYYEIWVRYTISSNQTISSDITLYPMVREDIGTNDTFEPYAKTNQQLTKDDIGLTANVFANGAVNLLPSGASSNYVNGVTFTANNDGTVSASGTATGASATINYVPNTPLKAGRYKLTGNPTNGYNISYVQVMFSDGTSAADTGTGDIFTLTSDVTITKVVLAVGKDKTAVGAFKPMITLADVPNSDYNHYVPYAKSNKELTDDVYSDWNNLAFSNSDYNDGGRGSIKYKKVGNLLFLLIHCEVAANLTVPRNTSNPIAQLPDGYRPQVQFRSSLFGSSGYTANPNVPIQCTIGTNGNISILTAETDGYTFPITYALWANMVVPC